MKYLPLIWTGLWHRPVRTLLTIISVVIAFFLFGLLQGVSSTFSLAIKKQKLDRLFVDSQFMQSLPLSYGAQIKKVQGVSQIAEIGFLGGYYQESKNYVLVIATDPLRYLDIRPEYKIPADQLTALMRTRTGAVISDWLAKSYGWKVGDKFTIRTEVPQKDGSADWTFDIVGIHKDPEAKGEAKFCFANFGFYDEARFSGQGTVSRFLLRTTDARGSARVAKDVDSLFATSSAPTRTQSEQEMAQSLLMRIGDIGFFTKAIIAAIAFTLIALTGHAMMESVRERTSELAVLKAIGFTDAGVIAILFAEALMLCVTAALVGLALAAAAFPLAERQVGTATLPPFVILVGSLLAVALAFVSTIVPAWRARSLSIVDALTVR